MNKLFVVGLALLLLVMPLGLAVGTAPSSSDTVAYYELENYIDSVGADDFTAPANAPTLATGIISNGYDFDETNNEYLVSDRKTGALSVSLWINTAFNTPGDPKNRIIIGNIAGIAGADSNNWHVTVGRMNGDGAGRLMFYTEDGAGYCIDAIPINDGNWHFITITIDGTTGTLYVDGNSKGTVTVTNGYTFGTSTNDIVLGNDLDDDDDGFSGIIDEVAFFDTVLTTSEITYMNNTGSPTSAQQYPFANNSVWVTAKNLSSDASLVNFSVSISGADFSSSVNDSGSGRVVFDNVSSGVYSVVVSKDGFSSSSYVLSMAGGSQQNIVAYLFTGDDTVLFTTVDSFSNAIIEGSTGGLYSLLNDTWVLVSSQLSDITGRIQFDILSNVSYKFIFDAVGYDQKVVLLKPLFASYTARLDPSVSVTPDVNVGGWVFSLNNSGEFFNGVNNSFLVSVLSTMGTLEYYYVNITDESGLVTELFCGVAGGCDNSTWLDISGASYDDVIGIELWVKESGVVLKYFKTLYLVQDVYNDFTARAWRDADFGDLEKALAASLVLLILVGFVSVGASFLGVPVVTVSAVVLGVGAEFFGAGIGFFPASIGHLIALGCLLIVLFGRGEI